LKLIGRTLAVLAAALVVVVFWLAIGSLSGSTGTMAGGMGGHGMESVGLTHTLTSYMLTVNNIINNIVRILVDNINHSHSIEAAESIDLSRRS
jgi:hypothetical protein